MSLIAQWEAVQARRERRRWLGSTAVIVLGGTVLLVAGHARLARSSPPTPPALPMMVELLPLPQAAAQPSAQPPGPRQQQAPKPQPAPPRPRPQPVPARTETPAPSEIVLPQAAEPAQESPQQLQPPAPQTSAPPGEDAPTSNHAAAPQQGAQSLASSVAQLDFRARLLGHLQRYKRYPASAQARRQQGVPLVRFTMDRSGSVLASTLERGSGHAALDTEALALLQRAQPLPELPEDITGATLEIVVPIEFFLKR